MLCPAREHRRARGSGPSRGLDVYRNISGRFRSPSHVVAALPERHGNPAADLYGVGDVRRFRSPAAVARYSGTAPIPCGSGQTAGRHRLHRGDNRQLNAALYRIALVQARDDPTGRAYVARNQAEGKTKREARWALQRHLANAVYRRLLTWADTALGSAMA